MQNPPTIRRLGAADARAFQTLRLEALQETPSAFASSYEEERELPLDVVAGRLEADGGSFVLGAFDGTQLVGCIGLKRESHRKHRHKAFIWGMYVTPTCRSTGLGRRLLHEALQLADATPGLRQVTLSVNATNAAARALYDRAGFQFFGLEPAALRIGDTLYDEVMLVRFVGAEA